MQPAVRASFWSESQTKSQASICSQAPIHRKASTNMHTEMPTMVWPQTKVFMHKHKDMHKKKCTAILGW